MKKYQLSLQSIITFLIAGFICLPTQALADNAQSGGPAFPAVVISEMQPGSALSASQEFVELYNQSASTIDLTKDGWQLQIASSTATDWTKAKSVHLTGLLYPGRYYLLTSNYTLSGDTKSYLQDYASVQFSSGLSASSGHIRLVNTLSLASSTPAEDELEWSTKTSGGQFISPAIDADGSFALSTDIPPGSSLKRIIDSAGRFVTTTVPLTNFLASPCPSPTATNTSALTIIFDPAVPIPTDIDATNQACIAPPSDSGSPITAPTTTPPSVLLPDDAMPPSSMAATIPDIDTGLEAPQITELLPNPAAPQTDATDEFIELYNGNETAFDLSGFILTAGSTNSQKYIFPSGTMLAAQSFSAFYAPDTGLSLSNSGGQVSLYDPLGNQIGQSDAYGTAKDGQAWALAAGTWYWTDAPSPGAGNVIHQVTLASTMKEATKAPPIPKVAIVKTPKATATKKATGTTTTKKKAVTVTKAPATQNAALVTPSPIHVQIIALIGGCALLYGAYEYRRDMANKFYQLRSNRAARRALRQSDQGRGGD